MACCRFFPDCSQNNEWPLHQRVSARWLKVYPWELFLRTAQERLSETKLQSWPVLALWLCVRNHPQITVYPFFASYALDSIHLGILTYYLWGDSSEDMCTRFAMGWSFKIKDYSFIYMQHDISDLSRSELGATQIFAFRYWRVLRKNREASMSFIVW